MGDLIICLQDVTVVGGFIECSVFKSSLLLNKYSQNGLRLKLSFSLCCQTLINIGGLN